MTERGRHDLARDVENLTIGASALQWDGAALTITIDERTVPLPSKLRGSIVVRPRGLTGVGFALDDAGRHRWRPIAPLCDVEVHLEAPALAWRGTGYLDTNDGDEPLEAAFRSWSWSRFDLGGRARIFYDVLQANGTRRGLALAVTDGRIEHTVEPFVQPLPTTGWGIARAVPCEPSGRPHLVRTLENAPFYARSAVRARIDGVDALGVHESLSLTRVAAPIVRLMLPFRMFRRAVARRVAVE